MKFIVILVATCALAGCSGFGAIHSTYAGNLDAGPTRANDPRLRQPSFYRNESDSMPWLNDAPHTNR